MAVLSKAPVITPSVALPAASACYDIHCICIDAVHELLRDEHYNDNDDNVCTKYMY